MEEAFLKRITEEPDEVTPRLVFADWLREQDDPALQDRGEFIHTQHALAMGTSAEERPKLLARQKELLARHRTGWEKPLLPLTVHCEYRLGFAERVTLTAAQFVDGFAELTERTPVVRVRLAGLTSATVGSVAASESLSRLRELDLSQRWVDAALLRELLSSPHLKKLRSLNLARNAVGDEGVRAIVSSKAFARLRYLNLSQSGIGITGVQTLVNAIYNRTTALEMLVLRGAPRVQPGAFPPVPAGLPLRLRQSLQSQLGLDLAPRESLLAELYDNRDALSPDFRRWVEYLHNRGCSELPRALKSLSLPEPLRAAFALACERRVVWKAGRTGSELPALALDAHGGTDLPEMLQLLMRMDDEPVMEARSLARCLLDLYQRHERGDLPADGRTR